MADNYLQFSEVIPHLSEKEAQWLQDQLQVVYVFGDQEYVESDVPEDLDPQAANWIGCRAYRDLPGCEPDDAENVGFEYEFSSGDEDGDWGQYLWIYADEYGYPERVGHLVQKFLRQFRPEEYWTLSYATTCSKPRVGEFGGGCLFVTAGKIEWSDTWDILEAHSEIFRENLPSGRLRQAMEALLDCAELNREGLDDSTRHAVGQARQLLAESYPAPTEGGTVPNGRNLVAMCERVAQSAENWADCSDLREAVAVFRELGQDCRRLLEQTPQADEVRRYILYDFDAGDLATTGVYGSYQEAADDASQLDNVTVIPLALERRHAVTADSRTTEPNPYYLTIEGPTFRSQRELLLKLQGLADQGSAYRPAPADHEVLEGLIELGDELADQAHDRYGIDCLLAPGEDKCDCQLPGEFCSGVPGILAHVEEGRLAPGAKVQRCDQCQRYPSDEAALEKLRELGIA